MRLKDPKSREDVDGRPDGYVDVSGDLVEVDDSGEFAHEAITREWAERYAEREGVDVGVVLVGESTQDAPEDADEICGFEKDDGGRCQRSPGWGRDVDTGPCKDHVDGV